MIVIDYRQLLDKIDNPPYTLYSASDRAAWLDECITTAHAFDAEPVKHDTELSSILQDYGIKDTDTLRYILDQYQKVIVEITHGRLSKLTYPADTIVNMEKDVSREYWEKELVKHGRWKITENVLSYEGTFDFIGCSKCGKGFLNDLCENNGADFVDVENDFLFCPFCGSKNRMDGDSE